MKFLKKYGLLIVLLVLLFVAFDVIVKKLSLNEMEERFISTIDLETGQKVYISHFYEINDDQMLVYIPKQMEIGTNIYYNEMAGFYFVTVSFMTYNYEKANYLELLSILW